MSSELADTLSIWGIEIEPYSEMATYHVGIDYDLWWRRKSNDEPPADILAYVTRDREGVVLAQAD